MKRVLLTVLLFAAICPLRAQDLLVPGLGDAVQKQRSIRVLSSHVHILASDSMEGRLTGQEGQRKAARYIVSQLELCGLQTVAKDSLGNDTWFQQWPYAKRFGDKKRSGPYSENIIGLLPATSPSAEYIVLSAHYDHLGIMNDSLFPGADDNGTGTAALLEMAWLFSMDSSVRSRNLLFIFFSGEEKGLLGSKYYADNPVIPMEKIFANINIDMVGRADSAHMKDSNYVYVIGSDRISKKLDSLLRAANELSHPLELDYTYNDPDDPQRLYERSDHYNFAKKGVPVIFFFSGLHADYHSPRDTPDKINFGILYDRMQLVYRVTRELSNYPGSLK